VNNNNYNNNKNNASKKLNISRFEHGKSQLSGHPQEEHVNNNYQKKP